MDIIKHKNTRIQLKPPRFKCDVPLTRRDISPFPNHNGFFLIAVGCPGAGKSSLTVSALCNKRVYRAVFDHIYIVPTRLPQVDEA